MSLKSNLTLRYMTMNDVPQVAVIDQLAFDIPWSKRSYEYEILESPNSYMVALELAREKPKSFWQRWIPGLNGSSLSERLIAGYGGLWQMDSEAHISTIAVHPRLRGRGWGEILLAGMVRRSMMVEADEVVLEVRVSNTRAQNLYRKYEFQMTRVKEGYYHNNHEDAYEMHLNLQSAALQARFAARYHDLLTRHDFRDIYTTNQPPKPTTRGF